MKISTFILMFLAIAAMLFIVGLASQETKLYYPEAGINDSEWYGKYDYSEQINTSIAPIKTSLENIGDENKGWFVKILSGIAAVPAAVISLAALVLGSFSFGGGIITGTLKTLGVPGILSIIIILMIVVWGIFKLIEVYQRWQL